MGNIINMYIYVWKLKLCRRVTKSQMLTCTNRKQNMWVFGSWVCGSDHGLPLNRFRSAWFHYKLCMIITLSHKYRLSYASAAVLSQKEKLLILLILNQFTNYIFIFCEQWFKSLLLQNCCMWERDYYDFIK